MSLSHRVESLINTGEYRVAHTILASERSLPEKLAAAKIFLQSHLGDLRKAQTAAAALLKRHTDPSTAAICRLIISRSWLVHGERTAEGLRLSSEAVEIARSNLGMPQHARYAADHVSTLLHRVNVTEASAHVPSLRRLVLACGDVQALASTVT